MSKIRWQSLRTKIIVWSFVPTAIILVAVALVILNTYRQVTQELVVEQNRELIRLAADQLAAELATHVTLLTQHPPPLADLARVTDPHQADAAARRTALSQATGYLEAFDAGVLILNDKGMVVAAEPERPDTVGQDWSDRPYLVPMLRHPEPVFSDVVTDGPRDTEVIVLAVPIKGAQDQFLGIVAGMFHVDAMLTNPLYHSITKLHIGEGKIVYLVDGHGRIIYHPDTNRIGEHLARDSDGRDTITQLASVAGTPWTLITQQSGAALSGASQGYAQFLLLLLMLGVVIPALVVAVGIRRITRPIAELIHATQEVAAGNFDQTITAHTGDELEELAEQFNLMSTQLREMVSALEQRVASLRQTKEALRQSEERYRGLFDGIPEGVYRSTPAGQFLDVNPALVEMLGYPDRATLLAVNAQSLYINPEDRARWQALLERDGIVREFEIRTQRYDGQIIWLSDNTRVVKNARGQTLYYEGITENITARKRAEAEREHILAAEREQRQLAEALRRAGAALSGTLNLNEVLDRILEQVSQVVPHDAANIMLIHGEIAHILRQRGREQFKTATPSAPISLNIADTPILLKMQQTGQPLTIPHVEHDEDGIYSGAERSWIQSYAGAPICIQEQSIGFLSVNSSTPGFFSQADAERLQAFAAQAAIAIENARLYDQIHQELGERIAAEEALREHRDHLEELVTERTAALTATNEQLQSEIAEREQLIAELDAFSHTVAHDLKSPLATMMGYARLLYESGDTLALETQHKCQHTIVRTGHKMNNIIAELLMLASVRKGEVQTAPLDMAHIVAEAQKRLVYTIEEQQAEIIVPADWPAALGYAPWIEEVWANYLSNAIKYGGQPPRVELGATVQEDGWIRFWIQDNGHGLTAEERARLFIPFTRLGLIRAEGHGLGLTIVQRIMEKLGGQAGVESNGAPGQGSVFYFTLPGVVESKQ